MLWKTIAARCVVGATLLALTFAPQGAKAQQAIQGSGATFPYPIYKVWFADFQKAGNPAVNYQAIGSGKGIANLKARIGDFAASDAPLQTADMAGLNGPVVQIPTVGGAVVISYNLPTIKTQLKFTPEIIAGMYTGKIKTWDDPKIKAINPGVALPGLAIQPVHRLDGSGTTFIFTSYLRKANGEWASTVGAGKTVSWPPVGLGGEKNDGVAAMVQRTAGALGYIELAYAVENHLAYGLVKNKAGAFVNPSVESTEAAIAQYITELRKNPATPTVDAPGTASYPICSLTYVMFYKNGVNNAAGATKLWSWCMQPAQQAKARGLYYAPLPPDLVKVNLANLKTIKGAQVVAGR